MARTIADITADIERLGRILRDHAIKATPLADLILHERIRLSNRREERREKRAERRAERHAEIDADEDTLCLLLEEPDISPYLKRQMEDWEEQLVGSRGEIDR